VSDWVIEFHSDFYGEYLDLREDVQDEQLASLIALRQPPAISEGKEKMTKKLEDVMNALPAARRKKIERRGQELLDEYQTLEELRKAQKLTQKELAQRLNINQENVSRIEKRSDMLLSTLQNHVRALGGELSITVQFPNHAPVTLTGIGQDNLDK